MSLPSGARLMPGDSHHLMDILGHGKSSHPSPKKIHLLHRASLYHQAGQLLKWGSGQGLQPQASLIKMGWETAGAGGIPGASQGLGQELWQLSC